MKLNNPFVLLSAKIVGIGVNLEYMRTDAAHNLCLEVEAVAWRWCREWQRKSVR